MKPKPHGFVKDLRIEELNATVTYVEFHPRRPSLDRIGLKRHCCGTEEEFSAATVKQYISGKKGKKYPELCRDCCRTRGAATWSNILEERKKASAFAFGPRWPVPSQGSEASYYGDCR